MGEHTGDGLIARGRHIKKDCLKTKKALESQNGGPAAIIQIDDGFESANVLVVTMKHSIGIVSWTRGCFFYVTPDERLFEDYKEINEGQVLLGNNKPCKVIGIGSMTIKTHDGIERILSSVRNVPELKRNLISLGMLD